MKLIKCPVPTTLVTQGEICTQVIYQALGQSDGLFLYGQNRSPVPASIKISVGRDPFIQHPWWRRLFKMKPKVIERGIEITFKLQDKLLTPLCFDLWLSKGEVIRACSSNGMVVVMGWANRIEGSTKGGEDGGEIEVRLLEGER